MENIINLEQLDYRDQLIKDYIDEHISPSAPSSIPAKLALTRFKDGDEGTDIQNIYIGFPKDADLDGVTLKFVRNSSVRKRNKAENIPSHRNKWKGFHEIWAFPTIEKRPLFELSWDENVEFEKLRYEYHKLTIKDPNGDFVPIWDYVQSDYPGLDEIQSNTILSHHRGGVVLVKEDKIISGHLQFHTLRDNDDNWRLSLY